MLKLRCSYIKGQLQNWATLLEGADIEFFKVHPKSYLLILLLVLICCVVRDNVLKGGVNTQSLVTKCHISKYFGAVSKYVLYTYVLAVEAVH